MTEPPGFSLPAPAKLNLTLRVLGRREDGHHDIETRFQRLSLHDVLHIEASDRLELRVEGQPGAPPGPDNLVLKAVRALEAASAMALPAAFHLHKAIPAGAGLGGGSSDAAAALVALARLHGLDLDLPAVAAGLGADVPFFLVEGGAAIGRGRGEALSPVAPATGWFALAWPGYEVATGQVYQAWDEVGGEGPNELWRAATAVEPRLAEFARGLGPGWVMTGSGSAFFLACPTDAEARAAVAGLDCWTAVAQPF